MEHLPIIIIALLLSAFFSGMEIAFVSSNKLRFELDNQKKTFLSRLLSLFYNHRDHFITTMVVGNNIVLVIYSMKMAELLEPYLIRLNLSSILIVLIQTLIATIIVLFFGEFLPKTVFRGNPNMWIKVFSPILSLFYILLYPIAKFTTSLSNLMLKMLHIESKEKNAPLNKVDLDYLVQDSIEQASSPDEIDNDVRIFHNALDFSNVKLRDCIVPRTEIIALDINTATIDELKEAFVNTGFSKILIYNEDIDNIIGYFHSSDLFRHPTDWREHIRNLPTVPETMAASKLMDTFMKEKKSIAVILDEFGGTAGIVTMEDIMEEIFGEIEDEHDMVNVVMKKISDTEYMFSGRVEIDAINQTYELDLPVSDDYLTVAGMILHHYEKFPKINEVITIDHWQFKVIQATNNRIEMVKLLVS
ncbi:MAG: hemolysin family protein [Bacteroidales bacterium]|nr:hemolysin family protein [Bacteroidales bacterium]